MRTLISTTLLSLVLASTGCKKKEEAAPAPKPAEGSAAMMGSAAAAMGSAAAALAANGANTAAAAMGSAAAAMGSAAAAAAVADPAAAAAPAMPEMPASGKDMTVDQAAAIQMAFSAKLSAAAAAGAGDCAKTAAALEPVVAEFKTFAKVGEEFDADEAKKKELDEKHGAHIEASMNAFVTALGPCKDDPAVGAVMDKL
ncbi:MAG: hypothetical protein R2939_20340 [Kofleriaceae bacterium]